MVRVSNEQVERNRQAIVAAADRLLRAKGYDGMGTRAVAEAAGLTEGAVFRNFATKAELGAAAVTAGYVPILSMLKALADLPGDAGRVRYIEGYLAADHRDHFPWGCPVGALSGEMHRHPPEMVAAYLEGLDEMLAGIARLTGTREAAATLLATLAGAIGLARARLAGGDQPGADQVLADVRTALLVPGATNLRN